MFGYRPRRPTTSQQALEKCRRSLSQSFKWLVLQIAMATRSRSPRNHGMGRDVAGLSRHLRRDIGLPPHGHSFFISGDTLRCSELYDSDLCSAAQLVRNPVRFNGPLFLPLQASIGVIFADLREFTTISEAMAPTEVMNLLRNFYSRMEVIALRHSGCVAVSTGDMLLMTFGIPTTGSSDATNALACARDMLDHHRQWNLERTVIGELPIAIGIGVHFGPVVSGMMGGERSAAFAVIGDTVNIANRLERLTRSLETDLVMSAMLVEQVCQEANSSHAVAGIEDLVQIGPQCLRGRNKTVSAYILPR